jgi:hypothetical protein
LKRHDKQKNPAIPNSIPQSNQREGVSLKKIHANNPVNINRTTPRGNKAVTSARAMARWAHMCALAAKVPKRINKTH